MLISFEKNFIFIHVPKTAGSSIRTILEQHSQQAGRTQWRRFLSHLPVSENQHKAYFRVHDTARWLKRKLPAETFDSFLKFAVVRNPYDYAVSTYLYSKKISRFSQRYFAANKDFYEFLRYLKRRKSIKPISQLAWICDRNDRILVDKLLRFETLETDFAELCTELHISPPDSIPRLNTTDRVHYREYFGSRERQLADELFEKDLRMLNYSF